MKKIQSNDFGTKLTNLDSHLNFEVVTKDETKAELNGDFLQLQQQEAGDVIVKYADELERIKSGYWKKIAENDQLRSENRKLKKKRAADDFAVYFFGGMGFVLLVVVMTIVWDWILS